MEHDMGQPELMQRGRRAKRKSKRTASRILPSRSRIHRQKVKKKSKARIKYPLISALSFFFILLPIIAYIVYKNYATNQVAFLTSLKGEEVAGYEVVDFAEPSRDGNQEQNRSQTVTASIEEDASLKQVSEMNEQFKEDKPEAEVIEHTVKENETLFSISVQYYGNEKGTKVIRDWNKLKGGKIEKGQVLEIPVLFENPPK